MGSVGNGFVINQWTGSSRGLINSLTEDRGMGPHTSSISLMFAHAQKGLSTDIIYENSILFVRIGIFLEKARYIYIQDAPF